MSAIAMKYLLEAGVHFGHQTKRWDPKMAQYIYTSRGDIYIIDLQKTTKKIDEAYKFLAKVSERGGKVLFVGTRKQAQNAIKDEAIRSNSFYITQRWLGGTLTNFKTIRSRVGRLEAIEKMEADGTFLVLPKKEVLELKKEAARLERFLGGIRNMKYLPDALFIVDPKKEKNAILEARILGIPVVGIVDTNCDPDDVDFVIPANDDAIKSVKLISVAMANAINEPKGDPIVDLSNEDSGYVFVDDTPRKPRKEYNNNRGRYNNNRPGGNNRYNNNSGGGNNNSRPSYNNRPDTRNAKPTTKPTEVAKPVVKVETPKVETPKVETPKVETPKVETPKVETPKVEVNTASAEVTLADLKAQAKEKGIKGYSTMKKAELIDALK